MIVIGIAGGSGSGKTTVVRNILKKIPENQVTFLSQDSYYRSQVHLTLAERQKTNFDHPDSIEFELLIDHIKRLKNNKPIEEPIYSYLTCTRSEETKHIEPKKVIILEGILIFCNKELRDLIDLKIFVDAEPDERLIRVIERDIRERGRNAEQVITRYQETVKPMHVQFIEPSKHFADIIVPQGGRNHAAVEMLSRFILHNIPLK